MNQPPQIAPKRERKTVSSSKGLWDIWEGKLLVVWCRWGVVILCLWVQNFIDLRLSLSRNPGLWSTKIPCKVIAV